MSYDSFCNRCNSYCPETPQHHPQVCVFFHGCPNCGLRYVTREHVRNCIVKKESPDLFFKKHVTSSSTEGNMDRFKPEHAVDGDPLTRWSSAHGDPQWIEVDLEDLAFINKVYIDWEVAYARSFEVHVSRNGLAWVTVYSTICNTLQSPKEIIFRSIRAKFVRIYCKERASQWGYSIWHLKGYYDPNLDSHDFEELPVTAIPVTPDTRPIPDQVRDSEWWKRISKSEINVIDERKFS